MDLAELRQRTLRRLDESTSAPVTIDGARVLAALNEGQRLFAAITLALERSENLTFSRGKTWYHVSDQLPGWWVPLRCVQRPFSAGRSTWDRAAGDNVLFDEESPNAGPPVRVRPARAAELDALDPHWQKAQGDDALRYGLYGYDLLFVYPAPSAESSDLEITYAATPRQLVLPGDVPEIPEQYHQFLVDFAVSTCRLPHGGSEFEKTLGGLHRFLDAAQQCADTVRARSRALDYDNQPFELRAFDRSRLLRSAGKKKAA